MVKRSEDELKRIVEKCVKIEKKGGSVIDYLKTEGYVSPRATWYNLQREWLHRPSCHFSDGRATGHPKYERFKKGYNFDELILLCVDGIRDGRSPIKTLAEIGYLHPRDQWHKLRVYAKNKAPHLWEKIPDEWRGRLVS